MQEDTPQPHGQTGTMQPGAMSELISSYDWSSTPLGHVAAWPDSLKAAVRILVTSRFPMWMAWGPKLTVLYNDAYARVTLGKKHPWALGKPAAEVWHEIWPDIGPRIERVMRTGQASWDETLGLILERSGFPEETYHTFSYSPFAGANGTIEGMLCVVMEDTQRVRGERQLSSLSTLAGALVDAKQERKFSRQLNAASQIRKIFPSHWSTVSKTAAPLSVWLRKPASSPAIPQRRAEMDGESVSAPWPVHILFEANRPMTSIGWAIASQNSRPESGTSRPTKPD